MNIKVELEAPAEVPYVWICHYLSFYLVISNHKVKEDNDIRQIFLNKDGRVLILFSDASFIPFEHTIGVFRSMQMAMDYIHNGRPYINREPLLPYIMGLELNKVRRYRLAKLELEMAEAEMVKASEDLGFTM